MQLMSSKASVRGAYNYKTTMRGGWARAWARRPEGPARGAEAASRFTPAASRPGRLRPSGHPGSGESASPQTERPSLLPGRGRSGQGERGRGPRHSGEACGGGGSGRGVHGASQRALRVRCPTRRSPRPNAALCACARFAQARAPRRPCRDAGLTRRCWLATFLCVRGPHDPTSPPRLPGRGRRALAEERDLAGRRS